MKENAKDNITVTRLVIESIILVLNIILLVSSLKGKNKADDKD
jgi:hypothetical protein